MFRYRHHSPEGDELDEATHAIMIQPVRRFSRETAGTSAYPT